MKKIIISTLVCLLAAATLSAQKPLKAGVLPVKGDFAIGVNSAPFLDYLGGVFSENGATAPTFEGMDGISDYTGLFGFPNDAIVIYGKYFLEDNRALRGKVRFDIGSITRKATLADDLNAGEQVSDAAKTFRTDIELSLGMEYRRGYGRLQGFWGYGATLGVNSMSMNVDYGNKMTMTNTDPTTSPFLDNMNTTKAFDGRITKWSTGMGFLLRPEAFAGVEYFFAKKMAIGGEFNVGLDLAFRGKGKMTCEYDNGSIKEETAKTWDKSRAASSIGINTVTSGQIYLLFHF